MKESGSKVFVKNITISEADAKKLVFEIQDGSISSYDKRLPLTLDYVKPTTGGLKSIYDVYTESFDSFRVINMNGNFTNLYAQYLINLQNDISEDPLDLTWNNWKYKNDSVNTLDLRDTYGRITGIKAESVLVPGKIYLGGSYNDGKPVYENVDILVQKAGWYVTSGDANITENKVGKLNFTNLDNTRKYTFRVYGSRFAGNHCSTLRLKVNDKYTTFYYQGKGAGSIVVEDVSPIKSIIEMVFISNKTEGDLINKGSAGVSWIEVDEHMSGSDPGIHDVFIKSAGLKDTPEGSTTTRDVLVHVSTFGESDAYRVCESSTDINTLPWVPTEVGVFDFHYTISASFGEKTILVQVRNKYTESNVKEFKCTYLDPHVPT
ncbi:MAG: hypothetical protein EOM35_07060 [Negativicutes bacterium]|nr:hypothetical protein [Negativicutes bacterium]